MESRPLRSPKIIKLQSSNAFFDIRGDGFAVHTAWVGPQTGILVNDPGGNQPITSITNLFGSQGTGGFAALSALDANHDGVIDVSDPGFANLRIWTDTNGNGTVDAGELRTLGDLGITSISLSAQTVNQTINGNAITATAIFTRSDGTTGTVAEASLVNDPTDSRFTSDYQINPEVLSLPNLRGYGTVPALYIAMSLDPTLLQMVKTLAGETAADAANFNAQILAIIYRWAGVENVDPTSHGLNINAQQLANTPSCRKTDRNSICGSRHSTRSMALASWSFCWVGSESSALTDWSSVNPSSR